MEDFVSQSFTDDDGELHRPILATLALVMYEFTAGLFFVVCVLTLVISISLILLKDSLGMAIFGVVASSFAIWLVYLWIEMCQRLWRGQSADLLLPAAISLSIGIVLLSSSIIYTMLRIKEYGLDSLFNESLLVGIPICSWFMQSGILGFVSRHAHEKWVMQIQRKIQGNKTHGS